jgi:hypothetical protein
MLVVVYLSQVLDWSDTLRALESDQRLQKKALSPRVRLIIREVLFEVLSLIDGEPSSQIVGRGSMHQALMSCWWWHYRAGVSSGMMSLLRHSGEGAAESALAVVWCSHQVTLAKALPSHTAIVLPSQRCEGAIKYTRLSACRTICPAQPWFKRAPSKK